MRILLQLGVVIVQLVLRRRSCEKVEVQADSPIGLLLHRHVAHLAANALHSSACPISVPGLRCSSSNVPLCFILEVLHPFSRQACCLQWLPQAL